MLHPLLILAGAAARYISARQRASSSAPDAGHRCARCGGPTTTALKCCDRLCCERCMRGMCTPLSANAARFECDFCGHSFVR